MYMYIYMYSSHSVQHTTLLYVLCIHVCGVGTCSYLKVTTVDREIFNCRNFRLSNFRIKIFLSLQHTDEN